MDRGDIILQERQRQNSNRMMLLYCWDTSASYESNSMSPCEEISTYQNPEQHVKVFSAEPLLPTVVL